MKPPVNLRILFGLLPALLLAGAARGDVVVNEFLAAGLEGFHDEFGDRCDWIELYNSGPAAADLTGWTLADDPAAPGWTLPALALEPGRHLLVCATPHDLTLYAPHYETIIDAGAQWRYLHGAEPAAGWSAPGFDDAAWPAGPSGFGCGDGDDATPLDADGALYVRREFEIPDPGLISFIVLQVDYDDAVVIYLNGDEVGRDNIGVAGTPPPHDAAATATRDPMLPGDLPPGRWLLDPELVHAGVNTLALSIHQADDDEADMSCLPVLTLGLAEPPPAAQGASPFIAPWLPHLHCGFELDADGETIVLRDAAGATRDAVAPSRLWMDVSLGRAPDGADAWLHFDAPTPGAANGEEGYGARCEPPTLSPAGGAHAGPVAVALAAPSSGLEIRYTLDGAEPTAASPLYAAPVDIAETAVLRARCFHPDLGASRIATATYLIDESSALPVVSLSLDPADLWSDETGIYVLGNGDYYPEPPYWGANFWRDWEKPAHVEFYEPDGAFGFAQDLGLRIHGGASRAFPQKSLRLVARGGYGADTIDYPLFPDKPLAGFSRLILRNGGNDWLETQLRDALIHDLTKGYDLDRQACRPAVVYLNGAYWGLHNIRERIDCNYLADNHGCDPDRVDLLQYEDDVIAGSLTAYAAMMTFIREHDLAAPEHFAVVDSLMDTDHYATYYIFQVFCNNADWPGNNIKFWREWTPGSRWRWILYDTEFGLGYYLDQQFDMLAYATDPDGCCWANRPWATFLIRSLLANDGFRRDFVNRYCELLGGVFLPDNLIADLDAHAAAIAGEMPRHFARWDGDPADWHAEVERVRTFLLERPGYAREHLRDMFGLGDTLRLAFAAEPADAGAVRLLTRDVSAPWSAPFFADHPVELRAAPRAGFVFDRWSDPNLPAEATIVVTPRQPTAYTALFRAETAAPVINEINYHSADDFDAGDWVELHNPHGEAVDLSGWGFRDGDADHLFTFPAGASLPAYDYLVLSADPELFDERFPRVEALAFDFRLDNDGERLALLDPFGETVDEVVYGDADPWPASPDGGGPTLELVNGFEDNALAANWEASVPALAPHGTPGDLNSVDCGCIDPNGQPVREVILSPPWPNPFAESVTFAFSLPATGPVKLSLHDAAGRLVARVVDDVLVKGWVQVTWTPTDAASGLYFARLEAGGWVRTAKVVFLR